jgi:lipid A 4'-phosphatase
MTAYEWRGLIWRQRSGAEWPPDTRLLSAYLLSGPATNRIGCFPFAVEHAARETGLRVERTSEIMADFEREGFARFDVGCGFVWIPDVLHQHPFQDSEEVRRSLPELAAVPREAAFRAELLQVFRASADRPGAPAPAEPTWLGDLIGDDQVSRLASRMAGFNARARRRLPGLPTFEAQRFQGLAQLLVNVGDYLRRCRRFLVDLVDTRALHALGFATIIGAILFVVFPGIDLGVARRFFDPPRSFSLGDSWVGRFFDTEIHFGMEWFLAVLAVVFLYGLIRGRPAWGLTPKKFLFVALSIGLGAGLLTNVILKDSWGRARPSQIVEFGGPKQFSPPFMRSTQCQKNCSFVSGDASLAATFMAFAVIAERHRRRWWIGLGSFTVVVGLMRMARGSHFLSDVVFAVIFSLMVVLVLDRIILQEKWREWPRWRVGPNG